ncbi:MAG: hypothetical protein K0S63_528 [Gammaproteobacteria bacterium]|nr:hypothetical protein [Gammaproteobacteria bacterium]
MTRSWQDWNANLIALSEITSGVGTTALTAGFLLTACGVIATSTALVVLPYLVPAVYIGVALLQLTHGFLLNKIGIHNALAWNEAISAGIFLFALTQSCLAPALCVLLGLNALAQASAGYSALEKMKETPGNNQVMENKILSSIREYIALSVVKAISWFIVAGGIMLFTPGVIAGGLAAITGTYVYSNIAPFFGSKKQGMGEENHPPLSFMNRMLLYSTLPM